MDHLPVEISFALRGDGYGVVSRTEQLSVHQQAKDALVAVIEKLVEGAPNRKVANARSCTESINMSLFSPSAKITSSFACAGGWCSVPAIVTWPGLNAPMLTPLPWPQERAMI